jgi:hypothetical protein
LKFAVAILLVACVCLTDAGRIGDTIRKVAKTFKEYNCVEPTEDHIADYVNFLKCHFPDYVPDKHHKERFANFMKCRQAMINWNPDQVGWSVGLTPFCHWTDEEFNAMLNNAWKYEAPDHRSLPLDEEIHNMPAPRADVNWASAGKVTAVKNQGSCGSCYGFGTAAALEVYYAIRYNKLVDFSPQQYVDCTTNLGNYGCGGGWPVNCLNYNKNYNKENAWSCYGYTGAQGSCRYSSSCSTNVVVTGVYQIRQGDENTMASVISQYGAIPVVMDFNNLGSYTGGIWDGSCGTATTHVVTVVGYGTDAATGRAYWLYKNSWGTGWGEKGYGRIARNKNKCGIANYAVYATIQ